MSAWVLDRVRDALVFAEEVSFTHGGEPLSAPILHDVLRAVRAARAGSPSFIHVLTNGALLSERMTARLVDEGVGSIAVSLDGATALANDRIRVGGDLLAIRENLRAAARFRGACGVDLALGIVCLVLRSNVGDLDAMVDLAAAVGVDWLRFEELVPVNPFAAREIVSPSDEGRRESIARAIERGKARGLLVHDRMETSPDPWRRACVEPDGEVRLGSPYGPRLGSATSTPFAELWNGLVARAAREQLA